MLYRVLEALIARGLTEALAEKLDVFYAAGKLTNEQYTALSGQIEER